jgi:acetyl-CoA synthetase
MYIAVKPGIEASDEEVAKKVAAQIDRSIGKIARPKNVWVVPDMPKTRSGKIMRRVIAGISNFADVGDVSTLANPEVVEQIREQVQGTKKERGEDVKELSKAEKEEIASYGSGSE